MSEEATAESLLVIHAGTTNGEKTGSEELLDEYRRDTQQYTITSINIVIPGVLPRVTAHYLLVYMQQGFHVTSIIAYQLCNDHRVELVDRWNDIYSQIGLFQGDGLYLPAVGSARFGPDC